MTGETASNRPVLHIDGDVTTLPEIADIRGWALDDGDPAYYLAKALVSIDFEYGTGIEYRNHKFIRVDQEMRGPAYIVIRNGEEDLDRIYPIAMGNGSMRKAGRVIDQLLSAESGSEPPLFRQAERQDRRLQ